MKRRAILTVSVLINLLFVGALAGHLLWPAPVGWHAVVDPAIRPLPPQRQQIIQAAFENIHRDIHDTHQAFCGTRDAWAQLLKAKPFDQKDYLEKVQAAQKLRDQIGMTIARGLADLAVQLSPEEREILSSIASRMTIKDYAAENAADQKIGCEFRNSASK